MTFSYFNTPNASDDPADSQPQMNTNYSSISSLISVDHVGFNVPSGGQHEQVTFNSNNPPATPTTPPILFINNQDGAGNSLPGSLSQLFFYSGSASAGKNNYVSTFNGSSIIMGGIIVKWGIVATPSDNVQINFPIPFPNNCFTVVATPIKSGSISSLTGFGLKQDPSVSGFILRFSGTNLNGVSYIAIGN